MKEFIYLEFFFPKEDSRKTQYFCHAIKKKQLRKDKKSVNINNVPLRKDKEV